VSLNEISVDRVRPLYGPVSGGTRVTISGQLLSVSTVTAVYIGQYKLYPDSKRYSTHKHYIVIVRCSAVFSLFLSEGPWQCFGNICWGHWL